MAEKIRQGQLFETTTGRVLGQLDHFGNKQYFAWQGEDGVLRSGPNSALVNIGSTAPAIIRGSVDVMKGNGGTVTPGAVDGAQRIVNATNLQATIDWANTNSKWVEFSNERVEYTATKVQGSRNVGLQFNTGALGAIGVPGAGNSLGTRLVQYADNHPCLTLSEMDNSGNRIAGGIFRGLRVGHGVNQPITNTQADGLLLGRMSWSTLDDLHVDPFMGGATYNPYIGIRIGDSSQQDFFNNTIGTIRTAGGQLNMFRLNANGTGNTWLNVYCGTGTFGNRVQLTDSAFKLQGYGLQSGVFGQLNVEWVIPGSQFPVVSLANDTLIDVLHLEGVKPVGFDIGVVHSDTSQVRINDLQMYDVWISSSGVTGVTRLLSGFSSGSNHPRMSVGKMKARWSGAGVNAEAVATSSFRLFGHNTGVGIRAFCQVDNFDITGHTARFHVDPTAATGALDQMGTGAAPGSAGSISAFESFRFHPKRIETIGATIEMVNANMTVYRAHRRPKILANTALTANRTLTLSDKLTSAGPGSASNGAAGDITQVHRVGAGAFDLVVADQAAATVATFTGAGSANTELNFEWSGTALTSV